MTIKYGDFIWPTLKSKLWPIATVHLPVKLQTMTFYFECPCQYYASWLVVGFLWWIWFFGSGEIPKEYRS